MIISKNTLLHFSILITFPFYDILICQISWIFYGANGERVQYQAWQHYLQECEAELPDECPTYVKALGQNCILDSECLKPAKCLDFKCQCPENFLSSAGRCVQAGLNQSCIHGRCAAPFVCSRRDICECPSHIENTATGCLPRCTEGELPFNGTCLKLEKLGGRCNASIQCQVAFSNCRNEKCDCISGTRERNGECQPTYTCPDGQKPLDNPQQRGEALRCYTQVCPNQDLPTRPTKIKVDTCPNGSNCVFPSYQDLRGLCCPEKPYCPVGEPMADKVCKNPRSEQERCPPTTHHCYVGPRGPTCCPLACPSIRGEVAVVDKGVCYPRRHLSEACNVTAQCPPPSVCNGTCSCLEGYLRQFGPFGEKCVKLCQPGEVLVRSECLPLSLPTRACIHSSQCTAGSKCSSGRCECPCGTMLYNGYCINKPQCPDFGYGIHDPMTIGNGTTIECSPAAVAIGNASCPENSFCFPAFVYSGGICCPFPDPTCIFGHSPPVDNRGGVQLCDLPSLTGGREPCPRGQYCHDYMLAMLPSLGRVLDRKGVCCLESQHLWQPDSRLGGRWLNNISSRSSDICPMFHQPLVEAGLLKTCNYYGYTRECGFTASCFLHKSSIHMPVHESGVCCVWQDG